MTKSVTIRAAWISAIAVIIAALIAVVGNFIIKQEGTQIKTEGGDSPVVVGNNNETTVQKIDRYYAIEGNVTFSNNNEVAGFVQDDIKKADSDKQKGLTFKLEGKEVIPEEGKYYTIEREVKSKISYMYKNGLVYVEYTNSDGIKGYYVIDDKGNLVENKLPYPLQEYTVQIPEDMVIRREVEALPNGFQKIHVVLKWGKSADYILDSEGKLQQISIKGGANVNNRSKVISPRSLEED